MKYKLTIREVRMLMIVPSVLIVGIYGFTLERTHRHEINALRQSTRAALAKPVPESKLHHLHDEIAALTAGVADEKRKVLAATRPSLVLPTRWTSPASRLTALADIGTVLDAHSIYVVSTAKQPDTGLNSVAAKSLQTFVSAVAKEGNAPVPEVWKIEVLGSYADVTKAVDELSHRDEFIVPLGISMEPVGEETNYRRWTIWIWV